MLLDLPWMLQTRRNHALEHATLHVLAVKHPTRKLAGHSNPTGFFIVGSVPLEDVTESAVTALRLLRSGDRDLAIHDGCGTNIATTALLAGGLAWLILRGARSNYGRLLRLPFAVGLAIVGTILSRPLGPRLQQRFTTQADMGDLKIEAVRETMHGAVSIHRVITQS
jgi:hypothetical protein